jgi:hypothetical protein
MFPPEEESLEEAGNHCDQYRQREDGPEVTFCFFVSASSPHLEPEVPLFCVSEAA